MEFVLYDGKIMRAREVNPGLSRLNSSLLFREEMWFANGEIPFFNPHMDNLEASFACLGNPPAAQLPPRNEIIRLLRRVINKNKAFMGGWIRMRFVIAPGEFHYWAYTDPCPTRTFPMDPTGRMASLGACRKYSGNPLVHFTWFSEPVWNTEILLRNGTKAGECIFLNEKGAVTETAGANLFVIRSNSLITPSDDTGCIRDTIRMPVMEAARDLGFMTGFSGDITPEELFEAEEIFTVAEARGFSWIMGIDTRRYVKTKTELIWKQFNKKGFTILS